MAYSSPSSSTSVAMPAGDHRPPFHELRPVSFDHKRNSVGRLDRSRTAFLTDSQGTSVLLCADRSPDKGWRSRGTVPGRIFSTLSDGEICVDAHHGASTCKVIKNFRSWLWEEYPRATPSSTTTTTTTTTTSNAWPRRPDRVGKKRLVVIAGSNDLEEYWRDGSSGDATPLADNAVGVYREQSAQLEDWCDQIFLVGVPYFKEDQGHGKHKNPPRNLYACTRAVDCLNRKLEGFCRDQSVIAAGITVWRYVHILPKDTVLRNDGLHWRHEIMFRRFYAVLVEAIADVEKRIELAKESVRQRDHHAVGTIFVGMRECVEWGARRERRLQEAAGTSVEQKYSQVERRMAVREARLDEREADLGRLAVRLESGLAYVDGLRAELDRKEEKRKAAKRIAKANAHAKKLKDKKSKERRRKKRREKPKELRLISKCKKMHRKGLLKD
ncbi:uncharacterized protein LOC129585532 [Paramacrobiotus metropolitanus]|uniref:uncharacterized protein LOC129585532 n=1 Tax=Paramacrobiotus metropolitanus TaxID=2943436 RepID=UPI00244637FD|nr:uncharacterized protein LOC129585532 [Paramacrobiotus metropolitanus]